MDQNVDFSSKPRSIEILASVSVRISPDPGVLVNVRSTVFRVLVSPHKPSKGEKWRRNEIHVELVIDKVCSTNDDEH